MSYLIDTEHCIACLACVRVCPTDAIAVSERVAPPVIMDELCIRCGECMTACPHDAVTVSGEVGRALAIAAQGDGMLVLSAESASHFYPALPEQVVNACYAAGFRVVTRGVIGDELVAAEYLRLWEEEPWGTLLRSTDPIVTEAIRTRYPELLPYLAPVATPPVAEARYLRSQFGAGTKVVYAGTAQQDRHPELDAVLTFADLEQLFRVRKVEVAGQPPYFVRMPQEGRRHLSAAGGMPLRILQTAQHSNRRFRAVRGLESLPAIARAVAEDRLDLGFVDILSGDGAADHPLAGPKEQLFRRRAMLASLEPTRSGSPVVDVTVVASVGAAFEFRQQAPAPDPAVVRGLLNAIGVGPNGRPWDCGACGFESCQEFAEMAALSRASLRQCAPYLERKVEEAERASAVDSLTGLATYRVLRDRLAYEIERSRRSQEHFAVLFLDLDGFKAVNDQFGHETGNTVLRGVASEITAAVRASDVAARYGGDEFVVILTRTDLAGAVRVGEVIRAGVEDLGRRMGYTAGTVTASIGIAEYNPSAPNEGDVLVTADRALYRAKGTGRNQVAQL